MLERRFTHKVIKFPASGEKPAAVGPFQGTADECRDWINLQFNDGLCAVGDIFWIVDVRDIVVVDTYLRSDTI